MPSSILPATATSSAQGRNFPKKKKNSRSRKVLVRDESQFGEVAGISRRHDDERLDEVALHLTPQDMKILRRRR
jgi:hypothetical protein